MAPFTTLRHRPLQTTLPWEYYGRPRLLAVTWAADAQAEHGARVCAVSPMAGQHHMPIGLPAICVAVTVALAGGMTLGQIVEAAGAVEVRYECSYGFRPMETVGALAARLVDYERDSVVAATYAIATYPGRRTDEGVEDDGGGEP